MRALLSLAPASGDRPPPSTLAPATLGTLHESPETPPAAASLLEAPEEEGGDVPGEAGAALRAQEDGSPPG